MVGTTLTENMIASGRRFLELLDSRNLVPLAAFWYFLQEDELWRFYIAEKELSDLGPKDAYSRVQKILAENDDSLPDFSLEKIYICPTNHPLIMALKPLVVTEGKENAQTRIQNSYSEGMVIEDAYIYRLLGNQTMAG
ncbi:MAG: hypothetical protein ACLFUS_15625 [Candidatus Sumerlaeia bacterium]